MLCDEFRSIELAIMMSEERTAKFCKQTENVEKKGNNNNNILIGIISGMVVTFICAFIGCFLWKRKKQTAFVVIADEEKEKSQELTAQDYLQIKQMDQIKERKPNLVNARRKSTF